uniref:Uncharacterized protein n=1 Tax=viral metagenome TaxID=1070528 RepID=A0A6C0CQF2_9ZZZZ
MTFIILNGIPTFGILDNNCTDSGSINPHTVVITQNKGRMNIYFYSIKKHTKNTEFYL